MAISSKSAWRFATAQSIGAQHVASAMPCQDSALCIADPHGNLIVAVSDGAGSAPHAHLGSAMAVAAAGDFLKTYLLRRDLAWVDALKAAARCGQGAIVVEAANRQEPLRSYACTLLLLVLTGEGGAALQIGDGVMALRESGQPWRHVFWPQKGEFVNTTHFLTDTDAESIWEVCALDAPFCDAAVMSDGLESLALRFADKTVHPGFFDGVIRPLLAVREAGPAAEVATELEAFLRSPRVTDRADDDLTLVLASRLT